MVPLCPDSESLREFNPCHNVDTGEFSNASEGRCSPAASAERKKVADIIRKVRGVWEDGHRPVINNGELLDARDRIRARKSVSAGFDLRGQRIAPHLLPDVQRAFKTEGVLVAKDTSPRSTSSSEFATRLVTLNPKADAGLGAAKRARELSVLRHEIGHVMPDALKRTGKLVGITVRELERAVQKHTADQFDRGDFGPYFTSISAKYVGEVEARVRTILEETRAWRNAIRFGRGRVSKQVMRTALTTYFNAAVGAHKTQEGARIKQRVLSHLERYADVVRLKYRAWRRAQRRALTEFNPCHNPADGRFCQTEGPADAGGSGGGRKLVRRWHLTNDPHFTVDPTRKPDLNRVFLSDILTGANPPGVFVTDASGVEYWKHAHGYERPYVAELEGEIAPPMPGAARVGHEEFMQGDVRVVRVVPLDEFAREHYGEMGWVESHFSDLPYHKQPKYRGYTARDVSQMSLDELKAWEKRFKAYTRRKR